MFYVVSVKYICSYIWFQCKTSECLVFLGSLVCLAWVVFSDHFVAKAVIIKQKYLLGYLFVSLQPLCYFFKGSELYFFSHTYSSLHSSISVQDKK